MDTAWWRRWHRWIGVPAALFLLFAATTGFLVATTEFFGEAEALRGDARSHEPVLHGVAGDRLVRADLQGAGRRPAAGAGRANRSDHRAVQGPAADGHALFLGKPGGGEDRLFVFDAKTGAFVKEDAYADKPMLNRIHSAEFFGDGGLVFAMFWAIALAILTASGLVIYWTMRRRNATGLQKVFW